MRKVIYPAAIGCILLLGWAVAAQDHRAPKVLRIVREEIKTGKMGAHNVEANSTVQVWAKAKSPHHRLALVPIAGNENEVLYFWPFESFADLETSTNDLDKIATVTYKADFDRMLMVNKGEDLHTSQRDSIAVLRPDLSYNPNADITKMRFMRVEIVRVKPGTVRDWEEGRRMMKAAHEKAKIDENMAVYQIVGGMQANTYLVVIPWKSLDGLATLPHGKDYWDAMGDGNRDKMDKTNSESIVFNEVGIYRLDPQLSYVPSQFVASDAFWTFKPMNAPADLNDSGKEAGQTMKNSIMKNFSALMFGVLFTGSIFFAAAPGVSAQDATKADAKHYKVMFENDQVRVLRVAYGVKEKSVLHSHPDAVAVSLTGTEGKFTLADNKSENRTFKAGEVRWSPAEVHTPENAGAKPFEVILVELKSRAAGSTTAGVAAADDPVKVDAEHHKLEFENDRVRVIRGSVAPGGKTAMHGHPANVVILLTDARVRSTSADGKTEETSAKAGEALWRGPLKHVSENIGDKPFEVVIVELKGT